ncbi:MAG: hypothetical protein JWP97_3149 [Labilithrix sp.]|nr:hypothetical protein [Labilithrix sp.]
MRTTTTLGVTMMLALLAGCGSSRNEAAPPASARGGETSPAGGAEAAASYAAKEAPATGGAPMMPRSSPAPMPAAAPMAPAPAGDMRMASAAPPGGPVLPTEGAPLARNEPMGGGLLTAGVWDDNKNFEFWKPYQARFSGAHGADFAMFGKQELEDSRAIAARTSGPRSELDVQLVLDTTGSMGDELSYLQTEFDAIAAQVKTKFPNVTPRWSLVVYRDHGDEYVARPFDFSTDTARFRRELAAQQAGGGGDTPEAVVEGLGTGLKQQWRTQGNVAKIVFWVADAPAHPGEGQKLAGVLREAKKKGVHIYPIASSDADDAAEYQMRSAAQLTAGRYVFLTNDSGVGNSHAEPHIPCYSVSRLDHAIVRMIETEMSGQPAPAPAEQVVRTVGSPDAAGRCKLPSGMLVASY